MRKLVKYVTLQIRSLYLLKALNRMELIDSPLVWRRFTQVRVSGNAMSKMIDFWCPWVVYIFGLMLPNMFSIDPFRIIVPLFLVINV